MNSPDAVSCRALLDECGTLWRADLEWRMSRWEAFGIDSPIMDTSYEGSFVVPTLPVDIHCHGLGTSDFSDLGPDDLGYVDRLAREQGIFCVPTLFLRRSYFHTFLEVMGEFAAHRRVGGLPNILGFALEGPLLEGQGGFPIDCGWQPDRSQWRHLASCGPLGLLYVVLSPDAQTFCDPGRTSGNTPSLTWITETLVEAGIRPALGHFRREDPDRSAHCIRELIAAVERVRGGPSPFAILTDHLFNDMPKAFKHAWRTPSEKACRDADIEAFRRRPWQWETLIAQIGPVAAELLCAARDGHLTVSLNFDGEHVDLAVCRAVVDLVGADHIIAMTDRVEVPTVAGQPLRIQRDTTLYYNDLGIVAAGTQGIARQMRNMRNMGLTEAEIWKMFCFVPHQAVSKAIHVDVNNPPKEATYVCRERENHPLYTHTDGSHIRQ